MHADACALQVDDAPCQDRKETKHDEIQHFLQAHMKRVMRAHGAPAPLHVVMPDRCAWHLLEHASLTATRALTWGFFPPLDEAFVVAGGQVSLRDICEVDATVIHEEIFLQLRIRIFLGQIDDLINVSLANGETGQTQLRSSAAALPRSMMEQMQAPLCSGSKMQRLAMP